MIAQNVTWGRAHRGSRRQLQDYVNEHETELTDSMMVALPSRLRELDARIRWVSPLTQDNYTEYRDADFLRAVGLGDHVDELARFWPFGRPSWDALGVISDSQAWIRPKVILVEAKSHVSEIYGSGCKQARTLVNESRVRWRSPRHGAGYMKIPIGLGGFTCQRIDSRTCISFVSV